MSIYQSALDLDDSKILDSSTNTEPSNGAKRISMNYLGSQPQIADEADVVVETTFPSESSNYRASTDDLYFRDAKIPIDFVLAYKVDDDFGDIRKTFEDNLYKEGLLLEAEEGRKIGFVKIHAPWEVLITYAEIMKFKLPMKKQVIEEEEGDGPNGGSDHQSVTSPSQLPAISKIKQFFKRCWKPISLDPKIFPHRAKVLSKEFSKDKIRLFNIPEPKEQFFSQSNRSRVVDFILKRKKFSNDPNSILAFGITRLLTTGVYTAAYPLHERNDDKVVDDNWTKLANEWAALSKFYKCQPLDYIKDYFGVKIGLYFAWLGFYTAMLIPASIVGLCCFIYGVATINSNVLSNDVCNKSLDIVMCPSCDKCQFWKLDNGCKQSRFIHIVDNDAMVFFAIFMSIWGTVFLELWKRYSATITYNWDVTGFDLSEEQPRPEYLAKLSVESQKKKKSPISNLFCNEQANQSNMSNEDLFNTSMEPYVSFWKRKLPAIIMSISVVLLLVSVAIVAVVGVIFYRMSVSAALMLQFGNDDEKTIFTLSASVVTTATAALINLVCILLLNQLYTRVANALTELEMPRTQTDYDDSLTLKMFLLQFVNYYASIFYIAFFKGKLIGFPAKYERFFGYRQEECGPGGCLMELSIQLAIIMVGKQALNAIMEMIIPRFLQWYSIYVSGGTDLQRTSPLTPDTASVEVEIRQGESSGTKSSAAYSVASWERDYTLIDSGSQGLFSEYLEMVLQFGFVTLFVSAFPLGPLFALINNILEVRLDASKFMHLFKRPVARRIPNIGVWYRIMDCIGKFSVVTNAFIIAFTSTFIPRLVYKHQISPDHSLNGYVNHSLSYFSVLDFEVPMTSSSLAMNMSYCRYDDYRAGPEGDYQLTTYFWYLLVIRLAFVVVFQNVVMFLITLLRWLVPDVPKKIQLKIRKDAYMTNEILVDFELKRKKETTDVSNSRKHLRKLSK
ncbi:hypothetical protein CHUAL_000318 [Chamberlinius hualienensis]